MPSARALRGVESGAGPAILRTIRDDDEMEANMSENTIKRFHYTQFVTYVDGVAVAHSTFSQSSEGEWVKADDAIKLARRLQHFERPWFGLRMWTWLFGMRAERVA